MEDTRDDRIRGDIHEQQSQLEDETVAGYSIGSGGPGDNDDDSQPADDGGSGMGGDRPTPSDY
jgi:hypothetical protein